MSLSLYVALFVLGTFIGSYLNVAGLRFSETDGFKTSLRGRSRCPYCGRQLRFYELVPIVSFLFQQGRCRTCRHRLSFQYPIVELLSGLVLVIVSYKLGVNLLSLFWILIFLLLILISIIDLRLKVIPDKLNLLLAASGLLLTSFYYFTPEIKSFLGNYALLFWPSEEKVIVGHLIIGPAFGLLLFGGLHLLTRGRGMGFGDVKLAGALGVLLGWPDALLAFLLAFILGSLTAAPLIMLGRKRLKDNLPFGPFLATGVTLVFFFGYHILNGYFKLFGLA